MVVGLFEGAMVAESSQWGSQSAERNAEGDLGPIIRAVG
jgi:hypothetical protein